VCTVVGRWDNRDPVPVQLLALRDEYVSRAYDEPGAWWDDQPDVIGGRDRRAGGSWCVSDVASGVTAVVLNRPERREAAAGAPSRGMLPLAGVRHGARWPDFVDVRGMAGFNLVLAGPDALQWWRFDGEHLEHESLAPGTWMFTPTGRRAPIPDARLATGEAHVGPDLGGASADVWPEWLAAVRDAEPSADVGALLVRRAVGDETYATVFGQLIASRPGALRIDYQRDPAARGPWTTARWP
jgi:hypothetical protein